MPSLLADETGQVHAVFVRDSNLFYTRSADGGQTFEPAVRVNQQVDFVAGGLFRGPELARTADGVLHMAWTNKAWQLGMPRQEYGLMHSRMRGMRREADDVNLTHGPMDGYSIVASGNGLQFAWHTDDQVFVARVAPAAADATPVVHAVPGLLPCECCDTAMSADADGSTTLVYRDREANHRNMYLVRLSPAGAVVSRVKLDQDDWIIEGCPVSGAALLSADGADIVAWERDGRVRILRVARATAAVPPAQDAGAGKYPVLAMSDGHLLLAINARKTIVWSVRDARSLKVIAAGTAASRNSSRPGAASLGGGRFLLAP